MQDGGAGEISQVVSGEVRAWMGRRGLRQADVAKALGVTTQAVSMRLTGKTAWTVDDLDVVAGLLRVPVTVLFTPPEEPS